MLKNRKNSALDISPLVACTLAYYGIKQYSRSPEVYDLHEIIAQKKQAAEGKPPVTPAGKGQGFTPV